MAIVKMKRVFLAALKSDRDDLLNELMKLSCVELSSADEGIMAEELSLLLSQSDKAQTTLENEVKKMGTAIEALGRYDKTKTPMFAKRKPVLASEAKDRTDSAQKAAEQVTGHISRLSELKNEENRLTTEIAMLQPYEALDIDLGNDSTAKTNLIIGTILANWTELTLEETIMNAGVELVLEILGGDNEVQYVFGLYPKDREEENWNVLKTLGFQKAGFRDFHGTAAENIALKNQRLAEINSERIKQQSALADLVPALVDLKTAYDYFAVELQRQKESERLLCSSDAFFAECWVAEDNAAKLEKLLSRYDCSFEIRDPAEGEDPPVQVRNSKLVEAFGAITELYSLPAYNGIDPNPFVAIFYFIFFGLMLSDVGYGAILAAICLTVSFKYKPEGFLGRLIFALGMCGISAIIWGVAFGSYFGDVIQIVGKTFFGREIGDISLWFNVMEDPMKMLIFCFILGLLHVFVGMGLRGHALIKEGKPWAALFDVGFWYIFIVGLILMVLAPGIGKPLAIGGAVGLILTQGRDQKNPVMKFFSGLYALYGITGYLSDVLSYSRVLALGLCTGVIASVFNTMGILGGRSIIGVIVFVAVFSLGTALNIALSGLGAFVHSARLHYVEFFGKFYIPGGKAFFPLAPKTKYIEIINEEA